ncbi:MAG: hypothetical protein IJZ74_10700 [Clostridia bacterium]|nr:hypothetical protein [Clostridia bacterium]
MLDSLHANSAQHLQLGEGLLLADVDLDALLSAEDPLSAIADAAAGEAAIGATLEGCVFSCVPAVLHTEARGNRTPVDGASLAGSWKVTLSGTMLACSCVNAARLLNTAVPEDTPHTVLPLPAAPSATAAMQCLCWIGTMGNGLLAIELHAPLSLKGMTFRAGYRGTGEMPFTFLAQQRSAADVTLPFRLHWLKGAFT